MKLWILKPAKDFAVCLPRVGDPWGNCWDCYLGFVVRAETELDARKIASQARGGDESRAVNVWLDEKYTICGELLASGDPGIVMSDFNSG